MYRGCRPHALTTIILRHLPAILWRLRSPRFIAVGVVALALVAAAMVAVLHLHPGSVAAALAGADPELLALAIGMYALGQTASGMMWRSCQEAGGVRGIPTGTLLGLHWIARGACELLPASLGEAVRVGLVRRHPAGAEAGAWRITGGLAGYKGIDAAVTALAVLALTLVVPLPGPASGLRWTAAGAIAVAAAAAIAWRLGARRGLAHRIPQRARSAAAKLGAGAGVLGDPRAARTAALYGIAAIVARVVSLAALLAAFGAPAAAAGLAFSLIVLSGVVPGAPGGAGTRELMLVPALAIAYGLPTDTALAFSFAVQAVALGTSLVVGLAALAWFGPRLSASAAEVAVAEPVTAAATT